MHCFQSDRTKKSESLFKFSIPKKIRSGRGNVPVEHSTTHFLHGSRIIYAACEKSSDRMQQTCLRAV